MPTFTKDGPASSLTVRMTPHKDEFHTLPLLKTSVKQITTYIEAVNYLLKSFATDANIVKATSKGARLRKATMETSV